jgi:diadenosine tetraphosphatase ApaH/serine/threonine PP2A family protein phosphatase
MAARAIISDVHANMEALSAVLEDMKREGVTEIISLGDVIGYGPNPRECVDVARDCFKVSIQGNHENALLVEMETASFNVRARSSLDWTREQFSMLGNEREENAPRWDWLGGLEETYQEDDMLFVHGTPRDPISEYLYPSDIYQPDKLGEIFSMVDRICFVGHTHVPGIWTEDMVYLSPEEVNYHYRFGHKKTIVNVGSVGQPRDGDPRATYVIYDDGAITYRRLEYPVEVTAAKIRAIPELDPSLAARLIAGR